MSSVGKVPLEIIPGRSFAVHLRYGFGPPPYEFFDLSAATAVLQIRSTVDAETVLAELTTQNGGIAMDADGRITLLMPPAETALVTWAAGVYDIKITMSPDDVRTPFAGPVTVRKVVTR